MDEKWNSVTTQDDISFLMRTFGAFHDGCIKEMRFVGGNAVHKNYSMSVTDDAALQIVVQRQWKNPEAVLLDFSELRGLHIDLPEKNDHIIFDAALFIRNGLLYWATSETWQGEAQLLPDGVWVCAKRLRWRVLENALGDEIIFQRGT